jgi:PAS domain S-box-containing protein
MFRLSRDGLVLDYRPPKDFSPVASLAEALANRSRKFLPAPVSERILAVVREVLHSRDSRTIEYQLPAGSHPAGTGSSGTDRRDFEGRVVTCGEDEVLFIVRDITERNRAVRALRQSETRYRLLADNVTDIIWTIDNEGRFTYISPSVQKVRGYTPEEAMAQTMSMKMSPESLEMIKGKAGEIWDAETDGGRFNKSLRFEVQQDHKAGYKLWTEVTPSLLRDENGVIIGAIGITRDITDRKIAEERLRKSEASLRMAQELANLGNWELGLESGKLHVSDQLYRIFGISRGQGWGGFELSFFHPDDLLLISEAFQRAMNNCYEPVEFRIVRPSGEIRTVYCAEARIIQSESGRSRRAVGTLQDITNRKREEEARRESEKTARALLNVQTNAALLLDADGHIVDINEVAAGYLRRPSADLLGACVFDFFPGGNRAAVAGDAANSAPQRAAMVF